MAKSDYLERCVLNHALRGIPFESPTAVFLALATVVGTDDVWAGEVSGGAYARQLIVFGPPGTPFPNQVTNSDALVFPMATAPWGTIRYFGIFDAVTDGNLLYHAPLTSPRPIGTNDQFIVPIGQILVGEN